MTGPEQQASHAEDKAQGKPASDWPSPGQKMQKLREELGLSQGRVADALHLTAHYIKALESDQFEKLPGKTFVKGYFRAYAKLLGADIEEVMTCYQQFVDGQEKTSETQASVIRAKKAHDQNLRWMVCAAAIIVVVVGISWWASQRQAGDSEAANTVAREATAAATATEAAAAMRATAGNTETPAGAPMTAAARMADLGDSADPEGMTGDPDVMPAVDTLAGVPDESGTALAVAEGQDNDFDATAVTDLADPVADAQAVTGETIESVSGLPDYTVTELNDSRLVQLESEGEDLLEVHFTGASWIEVDNGDNTRLYNDMLESGDDLSIRGKAPFNILVGDASVVDITFNSREVDVTNRMRTDNSARIVLEPETR